MLAAKFFDDKYYNNKYYALVGGIKNQELNLLERVFLENLQYQLFVLPEIFGKYSERLVINQI